MTEKQYYCDDCLSCRDYAIYDLSKADKSFDDFRDEDGFVESWRFGCYLCDETNSLMTGEDVVDKLNELNDFKDNVFKVIDKKREWHLLQAKKCRNQGNIKKAIKFEEAIMTLNILKRDIE